MDPNLPGSLEEQVATLRDRVLRLERMLQAYGIVEEPEQPAPAVPTSATPIEKTVTGSACRLRLHFPHRASSLRALQ